MRITAAAAVLVAFVALLPWSAAAQDGEPAAAESAAAEQPDPEAADLSEYKVRVGDVVLIDVFEHPELRQTYTVPGNGRVSFPPIGKLTLSGKTMSEIEVDITKRLVDEEYFADPRVGCIVTQFSPRTVYLFGAVHGAVPIPIHRNIRILELLAMSGTLGAAQADFSKITVRRRGADGQPYTIPVDVEDILERNDDEKNIIIRENDFVNVPRLQTIATTTGEFVYIIGEVNKAGSYPVVEGRTGFTLMKLIALAGDFKEFAARDEIVILRTTDTGQKRFVVDFDEIVENDRPPLVLEPDDVVFVPETFF